MACACAASVMQFFSREGFSNIYCCSHLPSRQGFSNIYCLISTLRGSPFGDIIISAETALRQAEEYGHGLEREMTYLAVHGMFHLLGYDHMTEEDKAEMRAKEEEALRAINLSEEYFDHPTGIH